MDGLRDIDFLEFSGALSNSERVLRYMARENRFARRFLTTVLAEFRDLALQRSVRARLVLSRSGVAYLFYNPPPEYDREERVKELSLRCHVARNELDNCDTIVGIGTNVEAAPEGFATDFWVLSAPEWTEEDRRNAEGIKRDLGYFESPKEKRVHMEEYPQR